MRKTVFVGMSGGVDSSVAAALLKKAGFRVVGIYLRCWDASLTPACTSVDDERTARLAAAHLDIPFYVWNFIEAYKAKVVDYLIEGYRKGLTPNPDIMCNKEIKFGLFYNKAMQLGADYIATGHYARLRLNSDGQARILQAADQNKDQSYFLAFIRPAVLQNVLFPIGDFIKPHVRELARKFGLANAERKDSQGICFVGNIEIEDFLKEYIPIKKGKIVDMQGKVLGEHEGAFYYTIGQRRGIKLAGGPYYVVNKDIKANTLVVSKEENDVMKKKVKVENINWFVPVPKNKDNLMVKLRYRQQDTPAVFVKNGSGGVLEFSQEQRAITPGQFAVFYREDELIGAGIIQ